MIIYAEYFVSKFTDLNCFLRNRVSNRTVNGMIASFVIWNRKQKKKKEVINNKKKKVHLIDFLIEKWDEGIYAPDRSQWS